MHFIARQCVKKKINFIDARSPTSKTGSAEGKTFGRTVQRRIKLDICRARINDPTGTG
jgi:hypothetical protein